MVKSKGQVPVTQRALVQRVNRLLAKEDRVIKAARGGAAVDLGDFYMVDTEINGIIEKHVDIEETARKLGALKPYEKLA